MQTKLSVSFLFCLIILSCTHIRSADTGKDTPALNNSKPHNQTAFILAAGDKISINVWRNDSLNRTVKLDPAGFISLPLVGDIQAEGMTIPQLRKQITDNLKKYIKSPHVDVNLEEIASQQVYVLGEVRSPGPLVVDAPMSIWEALARVGGFTNDANKTNVMIVRDENGKTRVLGVKMNLANLHEGSKIDNGIYLKNHDILYIPEKNLSTVERFMTRLTSILEPFISVERGIILGNSVKDIFQNKKTGTNITVSP